MLRRCGPDLRSVGLGMLLVVTTGCAALGEWEVGEREVIDRALVSSVQIVLEAQGDRFRSGSGVVIGARTTATSAECFILTSGHTFARLPEGAETYVLIERGLPPRSHATILAQRDTPDFDLALLRANVSRCLAARPGRLPELGDRIWSVGFPWGRNLRLAAGIVSQVTPGGAGRAKEQPRLMIDASVAYGSSGGGVFDARSGRLVGLVEGYGTARVSFGEKTSSEKTSAPHSALYLDVPVPGETYVIPVATIRRFLEEAGYADLLPPER